MCHLHGHHKKKDGESKVSATGHPVRKKPAKQIELHRKYESAFESDKCTAPHQQMAAWTAFLTASECAAPSGLPNSSI